MIREGRVEVNGEVAQLGASADPDRDRVTLDGERIRSEPQVYWMLHKPRGVLSTVVDPEGRLTVLDLVPERRHRVYPVGRLDRDTRGLLVLTNDGLLTQALLHPSQGVEREYLVRVEGEPSSRALRDLERGVWLDGRRGARSQVHGVQVDSGGGATRFHLTLVEGRKRQIRRSCLTVGHPVRDLLRVRFGSLKLGSLPESESRRLRAAELAELLALRVAGQAQQGGSGSGNPNAVSSRKPRRGGRFSKSSRRPSGER